MIQKIKVLSFLICISLVFTLNPTYSQDIIDLVYKNEGNQLDDLKWSSRKLKHGDNYKLNIGGVNSAHIKVIINPKSFNLQSNIPEPLKPLFSGITSNDYKKGAEKKFDFEAGFPIIFDKVKEEFEYLEKVRNSAKDLYDSTKFNPSTEELERVAEFYEIRIDSALVKEVKYSLSSISYFKERFSIWFNSRLESGEVVNSNAFELGKLFERIELAINENDYLGKATFLERSIEAKNEVPTSAFKAIKDGVDLQISIIDTYLKDTLYKGEIEFVNYGMWSFDFSTGFIFNRLVDTPYYLGPPSEGKKEVLSENYSNWDVAIGGFAHYTYKASGFLSIGPQIGIGVSILDAKPKYALGGGILLGRKGKIALTGGLIFGKRKVLSNQVEQVNGRYFVPESTTAVPTFERLGFSDTNNSKNLFNTNGYFSISYNLTKKSY